jgi:putative AdoMet-dependent methyltransferase
MKKLSVKQIEEINDEYYSNIDFLINEFQKLNRKLKYIKIDDINYIIEISK